MPAATCESFSNHVCVRLCVRVCACVHFVQASAQIDSIMKGQVRARRANLYILARHVSKKDIPLCHNVGQLAHTHTHIHLQLDAKRKSPSRSSSGYPCSSSLQATGNRVSVKCQAMASRPHVPLPSTSRSNPSPLCCGNTCDQARVFVSVNSAAPSPHAKCKFYL